MTTTVVIAENYDDNHAENFVVTWHQDEMPAYQTTYFDSLDEAKACEPSAVWQEPDEDASGDVILVAYF